MPTDFAAPESVFGTPQAHRAALASGVDVEVVPQLTARNRWTCAFRPLLAIPHLILVGGPAALTVSFVVRSDGTPQLEWGTSTGILGAGAAIVALIAWFAIVFGGHYPEPFQKVAAFYLNWRVRSVAYLTLLRDEYPPFGDGVYPATLSLEPAPTPRHRLSVAFRLLLALPHIATVFLLGIAWGLTTLVAWISIIFTGNFPATLYHFGVGVLRWSTRVEAYLLLLRDEYPPFSFE